MSGGRRYGDAIAHSFGLRSAPAFVTSGLTGSQIAVTHITCGPAQLGMSPQVPTEDTFILAFYLARLDRHELWSRGRPKVVQGYACNAMRIVNLQDEISANIIEPHQALSVYMPHGVLDAMSEEEDGQPVNTLRCMPGTIDPIVANLAASLMPALASPGQASQLFLDHVTLALGAHIIDKYGENALRRAAPKGGLSTYHTRLATELMTALVAGNPSLAELAQACGLSRGHFTRAFKITTGLSPHRWLLRHRIEKARDMLAHTDLPLAEVALRCGFADQSHLTRVFGTTVGDSPAAWRRRQAIRVEPSKKRPN